MVAAWYTLACDWLRGLETVRRVRVCMHAQPLMVVSACGLQHAMTVSMTEHRARPLLALQGRSDHGWVT